MYTCKSTDNAKQQHLTDKDTTSTLKHSQPLTLKNTQSKTVSFGSLYKHTDQCENSETNQNETNNQNWACSNLNQLQKFKLDQMRAGKIVKILLFNITEDFTHQNNPVTATLALHLSFWIKKYNIFHFHVQCVPTGFTFMWWGCCSLSFLT